MYRRACTFFFSSAAPSRSDLGAIQLHHVTIRSVFLLFLLCVRSGSFSEYRNYVLTSIDRRFGFSVQVLRRELASERGARANAERETAELQRLLGEKRAEADDLMRTAAVVSSRPVGSWMQP